MQMKRSLVAVFILLLTVTNSMAQSVDMADSLRSSGKIYVVVAVICVILIALILYLFTIDKKIKKIEDQK